MVGHWRREADKEKKKDIIGQVWFFDGQRVQSSTGKRIVQANWKTKRRSMFLCSHVEMQRCMLSPCSHGFIGLGLRLAGVLVCLGE